MHYLHKFTPCPTILIFQATQHCNTIKTFTRQPKLQFPSAENCDNRWRWSGAAPISSGVLGDTGRSL